MNLDKLKLLKKEDIYKVKELVWEFYQYHYQVLPYLINKLQSFDDIVYFIEEILSNENFYFYILEKNNDTIAYMILNERLVERKMMLKERKYFVLDALMVNKKYRRRGIAKALIDFAENFVREKGHNSLELDVLYINQKACDLYKSLGFFPTVIDMRCEF